MLVVLTLSCKLLCRSVAMLAMRLQGLGLSRYAEQASHRQLDPWMCVYNMSGQTATYFFQLALLVNATRWVALVLSHKGVVLSPLTRMFA